MQLEEGAVIANRYEIRTLIKAGGMGAVYRAFDRESHTHVALKEMLQDFGYGMERDQVRVKFEEEGRMLAVLSHPFIPRVLNHFAVDDQYYIVMEFIEGVNLEQVLEEYLSLTGRPVPAMEVVHYAIQICRVLGFLHMQTEPIVHRDIKPSNVILRKDRTEVVLVDFGLARGVSPLNTNTKTMVGTLGYASLEQIKGKPEPRSDLFSLGATMHHMLSGRMPRPFDIPPLKRIARWVPDVLCEFVDRATKENPAERFQTAAEMEAELWEILSSLEQQAEDAEPPPAHDSAVIDEVPDTSVVTRPASPTSSMASKPSEVEAILTEVREHRWARLAERRSLQGLAVLAVVLVVFFLAHGHKRAVGPGSSPASGVAVLQLSQASPFTASTSPAPQTPFAPVPAFSPSPDPEAAERERQAALDRASAEEEHVKRAADAPFAMFQSRVRARDQWQCGRYEGLTATENGAVLKTEARGSAVAMFRTRSASFAAHGLRFKLTQEAGNPTVVIYLGNLGVLLAVPNGDDYRNKIISVDVMDPSDPLPINRLKQAAMPYDIYSGTDDGATSHGYNLEVVDEGSDKTLSLTVNQSLGEPMHEQSRFFGTWTADQFGIGVFSAPDAPSKVEISGVALQ